MIANVSAIQVSQNSGFPGIGTPDASRGHGTRQIARLTPNAVRPQSSTAT